MIRRVLPLLAALLALLAVTATAGAAERPFSARWSDNVNGQIVMAANTIVKCPVDTADPLMNSECQGARRGTSDVNNNTLDMRWLDYDSDASTFDSSYATLALPGSGRVLFAGLYWTGSPTKGSVISGANGFKGVPQAAPTPSAIGTVKLRIPGSSSYQTITASQVDTASISNSGGFSAFADVTAIVRQAGSGTYAVGNVQTGTGGNAFGGWTLVVAYADPGEPLRNLAVFDGLRLVTKSAQVDIPVAGFKTPSTGTVRTAVGLVAAEGDAGMSGDYLTLDDRRLTDAVHPANNTENSTIADRGVSVTAKAPDWGNQLGFDSSIFEADGYLANGATSAMFRAKSTGDVYAPMAITFSTELYTPAIDVVKASPTSTDQPGDSKTWTITVTNNGTGTAADVGLVDPLPPGVGAPTSVAVTSGTGVAQYDAATNSVIARLGNSSGAFSNGFLGPGESVTVTIEAPIDATAALGQVIDNVAAVSFTPTDLGLPITKYADDATTVAYPDPAISKTLDRVVGTTYTFSVVIRNDGTLPTSGPIDVLDVPANLALTSMSGPGWSCTPPACTYAGVGGLAPGASSTTLTVVADAVVPGDPVSNDVAINGPGFGGEPTAPGSPALLNDSAVVDAGNAPSAELSFLKQTLTPRVRIGDTAAFRLTARNNGPAAATGTTIVDTLPVGLDYASFEGDGVTCSATGGGPAATTITCDAGTVAVGDQVAITIYARPRAEVAAQTLANNAQATSDLSTPALDGSTIDVDPLTDLAVSKTASAATADPGGSITYAITLTNAGTFAAHDPQVVDVLPDAADPDAIGAVVPSAGGTCTVVGRVVSCLWDHAIAPGGHETVSITASMLGVVPPVDRKALNVATASTSDVDANPSNDSDSALVTIVPAADLHAQITGPSTLEVGATGTVTVTGGNVGPSSGDNAVMTITLPSGLTPVSAPPGCDISGQTVTCAVGDLGSGERVQREIEVRATKDLTEALRRARVDISSDTDDPVAENNVDITPITVGPIADLTIAKRVDDATPDPGQKLTYTITVGNLGPSTSEGAVVTDVLPQGLTPIGVWSSPRDRCSLDGSTVTCRVGQIVPGASFKVLVQARVKANEYGSRIANTARVEPGPQRDRNGANNDATSIVRVTSEPDEQARLAITTSASPWKMNVGSPVRVTAVVRNVSRIRANSPYICISVPTTLRYLSSSSRLRHGRVCWLRDVLLPGRQVTVSYLAVAQRPGALRPLGTADAGNAASVWDPAAATVVPGDVPVTG